MKPELLILLFILLGQIIVGEYLDRVLLKCELAQVQVAQCTETNISARYNLVARSRAHA